MVIEEQGSGRDGKRLFTIPLLQLFTTSENHDAKFWIGNNARGTQSHKGTRSYKSRTKQKTHPGYKASSAHL